MTWQSLFPILFFICVGIQLVYLLGVFTALLRHVNFDKETPNQEFPPVSIVLAAWNELPNLKELIPLLRDQDYPEFEIVLVDDRSEDGTYDALINGDFDAPNLQFVRIKALPQHFTAKKYAITMGIKKSQHNYLVFTDADCRPSSNQWLKSMVTQVTSDTSLVLGFSPYYKEEGTLNAFIRYETFQTAVQYLSFAAAGIPFMGVGRNLLYKKEAFWSNKGFAKHNHLLSGDDDLFVNQASNKYNTEIRTDPESYVWSEPKRTFKEWVTQKKRHLSVGKHYKTRDKLNLGLLWLSFMGCWLLALPAFFNEISGFILPNWLIIPDGELLKIGLIHWTPFTNWMRVVTVIFVCWLLIRWLVLYLCNKKLDRTVHSGKILGYDFLYALYLLVFGVITLFSNPKKITWK